MKEQTFDHGQQDVNTLLRLILTFAKETRDDKKRTKLKINYIEMKVPRSIGGVLLGDK